MPPLVFSAILLASPQLLDRAERLNDPLEALLTVGSVEEFRPSASGQFVLYRASQDEAVDGLYVVPADGSAGATRLSLPGEDVGEFRVSPSGLRAVYRAGTTLARVGVTGVPVTLTDTFAAGADAFDISPDGQWVVFTADVDGDGRRELRAAPMAGAATLVALELGLPADNGVVDFVFAPDSSTVVFNAQASAGQPLELFAVPIDGSATPLALCGAITPGGNVVTAFSRGYRVSPDSSRVVYLADQLVDAQTELFSASLDGSASAVRLSGAIAPNRDVWSFEISPDSAWVVYRSDTGVDEVIDLRTAPIGGGAAPVRINGAEVDMSGMQISPDSSRVLYSARAPGDSFRQYLAPIATFGASASLGQGSVIRFSTNPAEMFLVIAGHLFVGPVDQSSPPVQLDSLDQVFSAQVMDDGRVLLEGRETPTSARQYFTMTLGSGLPEVPLPVAPGLALNPLVAGSRVVARFLLDVTELFSTAFDGSGAFERLNGPLATMPVPSQLTGFALAPDGSSLTYATNWDVRSRSVLEEGPSTVLLVTPGTIPGAPGQIAYDPAGTRVFFRASFFAGVSQGNHLCTALAGDETSFRFLSEGAFAPPFGAGPYLLSPDGTHLTYSVGTYDGFGGGFRAVAADGSASPEALGGAAGLTPVYTSDGERVLFRQWPQSPHFDYGIGLHVAPVDGSAATIELAPIPFGTLDRTLQADLSADETEVVFCRTDASVGIARLYRVPIDGTGSAVEIGAPLAPGSLGILGFRSTPDRTRVVYAGDVTSVGSRELLIVPVDGSAAPLSLSGPVPSGEGVVSEPGTDTTSRRPLVWFTPDGTEAVYNAGRDLFRVPLDGSAAPVRLTTHVTGNLEASLGGLRITADGTTAVYRADALVSGRFELFVVPVDGSAASRAISGTLASDRDVAPGFVLVESRAGVLYRADAAADERVQLWFAPLDGRRAPTTRSPLVNPQGAVEADFAVSPDEAWVYYRADALVNGVPELYRFPLDRVPRMAPHAGPR